MSGYAALFGHQLQTFRKISVPSSSRSSRHSFCTKDSFMSTFFFLIMQNMFLLEKQSQTWPIIRRLSNCPTLWLAVPRHTVLLDKPTIFARVCKRHLCVGMSKRMDSHIKGNKNTVRIIKQKKISAGEIKSIPSYYTQQYSNVPVCCSDSIFGNASAMRRSSILFS